MPQLFSQMRMSCESFGAGFLLRPRPQHSSTAANPVHTPCAGCTRHGLQPGWRWSQLHIPGQILPAWYSYKNFIAVPINTGLASLLI